MYKVSKEKFWNRIDSTLRRLNQIYKKNKTVIFFLQTKRKTLEYCWISSRMMLATECETWSPCETILNFDESIENWHEDDVCWSSKFNLKKKKQKLTIKWTVSIKFTLNVIVKLSVWNCSIKWIDFCLFDFGLIVISDSVAQRTL